MATNDIHIRAQKVGNHGLGTMELAPYNGYKKHPGGNFLVPDGYNVQAKHRVIARQAPLSAVNGATILNAQPVAFKIERNSLSVLTNMYLQFKITNSTGAGVTLAPTPFWIDRIEVLDSNGNILTNIYGQQLYLSLAMLDRDIFEQSAARFCLSTAYATTGTVLANGASGVYYIPIYHLFSAAKLHLGGLKSELELRVHTQSSTYTLIAGSHPTVTDVSLILKGYQEPNQSREARRIAYNGQRLNLKLPFVNFISFKDILTLGTSATYSSVLSTIKGTILGLFFTIRDSAITAANQGNYQAITSYDVQLASGESLTGHYTKLHEDQKLECAELFPNVFSNNKDWYFIAFSPEPVHDYGSGGVHGYQVFSGTEKLVFTTNSTIVPGSFQIDVYALSAEHLHVENGAIRTHK